MCAGSASAAAAADRDLDLLAGREERAVVHLGDRDDVLRLASRMRVLASATPLAGEKWKVATPARGLPSATTRTSVT